MSYKQHKEAPIPGTGMVFDLGSHLIDQALVLCGKPDAVFADIAIMRPVSKVDDYFELILYYPRHRVRLRASYQVREPIPGFIIHGSKGSFLKSRADVQEADLLAGKKPGSKNWGVEPDSEKGLLHTEKDGKVIREHIPTTAGNYGLYYDGIFNAIRNNKPLPVTAEDGFNVIKVIESSHLRVTVNERLLIPARSPQSLPQHALQIRCVLRGTLRLSRHRTIDMHLVRIVISPTRNLTSNHSMSRCYQPCGHRRVPAARFLIV